MKPYYDDGKGIVIYHGDCREILPQLPKVDLVLTDPPYGINWNTAYKTGREQIYLKRTDRWNWQGRDHAAIHGDDKPFDPTFLLTFKHLALFGPNSYASRLPDSYSWLVWDKKTERGASNRFGDAELIYCRGANFSSVRIYRHMWSGYQRDSETGERVLHPTQKPAELIRWIIGFFDCSGTILDPFMGSGPTLRAAKDLHRQAIGIEIEEKYCEIAAKRLAQEVLAL